MSPRIAVVGIHGHGASHVSNALEMGELVAVVDPRPPEPTSPATQAQWFSAVDEMLADARPEVAVLCTPLPTHAPLAAQLMRAGCDLLLEKPPTTTMAEFTGLGDVVAETGRRCQVGFQSLGSQAVGFTQDLIASGALGELSHVGAVGTWMRRRTYWQRAPWAGRRTLNGQPVVDGVVTNPLAHATATALRLVEARRVEDVTEVAVELFHANDIEADDTSAIQVSTAAGVPIWGGFTLCAPEQQDPHVTVYGSAGQVQIDYTTDVVHVRLDGEQEQTHEVGRVDLLANLIAARAGEAELLNPLSDNGAFMRVMEAVRVAPEPRPIDSHAITWVDEGPDAHPVVTDIEQIVNTVAAQGVSLRGAGATWA